MSHENCIFCKIIDGDIPSAKVYEDEHVYAFLDISQVTKGHTLVIPKIHTRNIYDASAEVSQELFARVPKISNAIKDVYNPAGLNVLVNNEMPAGQTVFHLHIHLIPKYEEDEGFTVNWETHDKDYTPEKLRQIAQEINDKIED